MLETAKHSAICISAVPTAFDRYPRGFTGHVARPTRSIRGGRSWKSKRVLHKNSGIEGDDV